MKFDVGYPDVMLRNIPQEHRPKGMGEDATFEFGRTAIQREIDGELKTVLHVQDVVDIAQKRAGVQAFYYEVAYELANMLRYAKNAVDPSIFMAEQPQIAGSEERTQYIFNFSCSDKKKPNNPNQMNYHGQNTSQWLYAGAIVVDVNGHVSTHH